MPIPPSWTQKSTHPTTFPPLHPPKPERPAQKLKRALWTHGEPASPAFLTPVGLQGSPYPCRAAGRNVDKFRMSTVMISLQIIHISFIVAAPAEEFQKGWDLQFRRYIQTCKKGSRNKKRPHCHASSTKHQNHPKQRGNKLEQENAPWAQIMPKI